MYVTTTEAARLLGLTRQRVLKLIEPGRLKAKKFGRVWMISRTSVTAEMARDRKRGRPSSK